MQPIEGDLDLWTDRNQNALDQPTVTEVRHPTADGRATDVKFTRNALGEGVRQGLTFDDVKRIKFPVPPLGEQRKIAELLDQKWALIDSLRDQLKCQIARLEALKRSMVYADAIGECPEQMFRKVPR